jgi:protease I
VPDIADSKILIVATDGFEESELFGPREMLIDMGADVRLASPEPRPIQATVHDDPGKTIRPDMLIEEARAADFDALILPGGVRNPDALRTNKAAIALIRDFAEAGKPVAAICHGPWLLVEADLVRGRTVTSWPSIRTDLRNAGGNVVDEPVAVDGNIITSRKPDDVQPFTQAIATLLESAGQHAAA